MTTTPDRSKRSGPGRNKMSTPDRNQRNVGGDQSVPGIEDDVQSVTGVSAAGKSVQGESRTAAARTGPVDSKS